MSHLATRFAPTPNGHLHLGNFYNLLWVGIHARRTGALVGLRIDDYDQTRYRTHFVDAIFATLERAGFEWDIGPTSTGDFELNHSSRHRRDLYAQAEAQLKQSSRTYWCTCTRKMEPGPIYSGHCRNLRLGPRDQHEGLDAQLRFAVAGRELEASIGDFIVVPRGGELAYHLASVVDDAHYRYNLLVRGLDLEPSSLAQCELAPQMGYPNFAQNTLVHHALLASADGGKLSKSQSSPAVLDRLQSPGGLAKILQEFAQTQLSHLGERAVPSTLREFFDWAQQ